MDVQYLSDVHPAKGILLNMIPATSGFVYVDRSVNPKTFYFNRSLLIGHSFVFHRSPRKLAILQINYIDCKKKI